MDRTIEQKGGKKQMERKHGMERRRFFLKGAVIFFIFLFLSTVFTGVGVAAEAKPIKLGLLLPLTGPMSTLGELNKRGFDLALDKINKEGGIKSLGGAKIEFVIGDSESDPKVAASETEKLITLHKVPIVTGSYASALCFTASAIAERNKTPFWEVSATADKITEQGFKYVFRTIANGSDFAGTAIHFLNALKYKKIAIVTEDSLAGETANGVFQKLAKQFGMEIVANVKHPHDVPSLTAEVLKVKSANPQAIAAGQYTTDSILFTKTMKELDLNVNVYAGTYGGGSDPQFQRSLGETANYVYGCSVYNWDMKTAGSEEFLKNYREKYKGENPTLHPGYCYMGMMVLRDVLERAGSLDAAKVIDAAEKTDIKETLTGYGVKFDPKTHHNIRATYASIVQWQKGELVTVWPEHYASKKPIAPMPKWKDR
jgi:branched-chain amino acid transport system substrate-binding protein